MSFSPKAQRTATQGSPGGGHKDDSNDKVGITISANIEKKLAAAKTTYIKSDSNPHKQPVGDELMALVKADVIAYHKQRDAGGGITDNWKAGLQGFSNQVSPGVCRASVLDFIIGIRGKLTAEDIEPHVGTWKFALTTGVGFTSATTEYGCFEEFLAAVKEHGEAVTDCPDGAPMLANDQARIAELEGRVRDMEEFLTTLPDVNALKALLAGKKK